MKLFDKEYFMKNIIGKIVIFILVLLVALILYSCVTEPKESEPIHYPIKISIKNGTTVYLTVQLEVGEIPNMQAGYAELKEVPDEYYKLCSPIWTAEYGTKNTIKPKKHDFVFNNLPVAGIAIPISQHGTPNSNLTDEEIVAIEKLKEGMINKLFSFILTIKQDENIIYRFVGWDISDEDMEKNHVNEKMLGFYDTNEEKFLNKDGTINTYPLFYSDFWGSDIDAWEAFLGVYFFMEITEKSYLIELNPPNRLNDDYYWDKN